MENNMHYLTELAHKYGTDRGTVFKHRSTGHGYTEVWGPLFDPIKNDVKKVLEIGVHKGQGMLMWQEYFPNADIYGIEVFEPNNLWKAPEGPSYTEADTRIHVMVGHAGKKEDLDKLIEKFGGDFDIIIDDGGHLSDQQQFSMGYLFPFLKPSGIYIIEDLGTAYHSPQYIGSVDTVRMIQEYHETKKIVSEHMTDSQIKYIEDNISGNTLQNTLGVGKLWIVNKKS
tara:strand:- start:364 stop:1044 length:681 start_codon:yes stop_codon:yes gene_type:complete